MIGHSVDADLFKAIINKCVALALDDILNIIDIDADVKNIEYCPVWTLDSSGKKKLLKIRVRMTGSQTFSEVDGSNMSPTGLTINELLEYLTRSDATRTIIN